MTASHESEGVRGGIVQRVVLSAMRASSMGCAGGHCNGFIGVTLHGPLTDSFWS